GQIPPIDSKNPKSEEFALHKRKTSAYLPRNELYFAFNRKTSAYFTFNFTAYSIKDKISYLKRS
ncbi:hypothetical protein, partial [Neobacillus drentensis]|uniref:hypothetical protein n=1 Tax=Neobacillus drentensis TaxID=220684 RepID=UPI001C3F3B41